MGVLGVKEGFFKLMRRKVEGGGGNLGMCFLGGSRSKELCYM